MRILLRARLSLLCGLFVLMIAAVPVALGAGRQHHRRATHRVGTKHRHRTVSRRRTTRARIAAVKNRPRVSSAPATGITASSATLNGSVNPNGDATTYHFQYGKSTSYGSNTTSASLPAGNRASAVIASIVSLSPSTTYHYRIVATNANGSASGSDATFTTSPAAALPPTVTTAAATGVSASGATLNGSVNPNGLATTVYYQYGPTSSYGSATAPQNAGSGTGAAPEPVTLTGLSAATSYHFRIVASSSAGTSLGVDQSFVTSPATSSSYDQVVLADHPAAFYDMSGTATEPDLTGNGHAGTYKGGPSGGASLPNGERATDFNAGSAHSGQYLTIPSSAAFSISTARQLTWEAWIRPDVLQFANPASSDQYVDWMGKCQDYSPTCEWEARMYSAQTPENRPNRLSAYAFNPTAGLGSGADWQPAAGVIAAGQWLHVVGEYETLTTPSRCSTAYPGTINIWVDGVKQNFAYHAPTGCMSQYKIIPVAGSSPVNVGTMALDSWFQGAIGKVAVYDSLLDQTQINAHYAAMTGAAPSGSCADTCTVP